MLKAVGGDWSERNTAGKWRSGNLADETVAIWQMKIPLGNLEIGRAHV